MAAGRASDVFDARADTVALHDAAADRSGNRRRNILDDAGDRQRHQAGEFKGRARESGAGQGVRLFRIRAAEIPAGRQWRRRRLAGACHTRAPAGIEDPQMSGRFETRVRAVRHRSRSEEHTSELQSLMRISYAVFCWNKKTKQTTTT